jgi:hypothetical protein
MIEEELQGKLSLQCLFDLIVGEGYARHPFLSVKTKQ